MGSLNAPGVFVVPKQNVSFRNQGGALTATSGYLPQTGPTSEKVVTLIQTEGFNRSSADFGTQPDKAVSQYNVLGQGNQQKVTSSLTDTDISVVFGGPDIDGDSQPEIANKPISQYSAHHGNATIVVTDSDTDTLILRHKSNGA